MNRASGENLPGLLIAQDLTLFHDVITHIQSVENKDKK
jgi:hypothetical protein